MRVAFLLLVLANLLFFGWANWVDRPVRRGLSSAVPSLTLTLAAPAIAPTSHCRSVGPYPGEAAASAASAVLAQRGLSAHARSIDVAGNEGYWVYVPAPDEATQRRVLGQLRGAGLRDAAPMREGAGGGRVSTGIFNERGGAEERAAAVRRAGLEPVIEPRQKIGVEWWVDVTLPAGDAELHGSDAELAQGLADWRIADCR
jgi:hypothetical protein